MNPINSHHHLSLYLQIQTSQLHNHFLLLFFSLSLSLSPNNSMSSGGAKASGKDESRKPAQDPAVKCPRCDSPNTKFCYYNNYSLTQPRHFCKTCRRYWTKGGALRSVPIGGSCRKNKKSRTSPPPSAGDDASDGLKFFKGVAPAMDFQLNFPATSLLNNQFDNSSNISTAISLNPCYAFDPSAAPLIGFDLSGNNTPNPELGFRSSLASSMESLSCINQDLHWKLQKQRLAMLSPADNNNNQKTVKPQPILFQDLEVPIKAPRKIDDSGNPSTEWFFDNSSYSYGGNAAATSNGVNGDNGSGWSNGIQAWSDLSHYSSIP